MGGDKKPLAPRTREALLKEFPLNETGRDFAVGDLHGTYSVLEELMERVDFDPTCDRLFSVGDLIDRGPESDRTLEFLAYEWFHAVQGNHERMLVDAVDNSGDDFENWVTNNGGEWWLDIDEPTQHVFRKAIDALPIAMQIETAMGSVGVIHADVPANVAWSDFFDRMSENPDLMYYALWSRYRLKRAELTGDVPPVEGIDLLVVGHTPLRQALQLQNIYYLDTAAAYSRELEDAKLTLLQFHPDLKIHTLDTAGLLELEPEA
jgi:serine/threonine protein phosphatase 1